MMSDKRILVQVGCIVGLLVIALYTSFTYTQSHTSTGSPVRLLKIVHFATPQRISSRKVICLGAKELQYVNLQFSRCDYSNCDLRLCLNSSSLLKADVILFHRRLKAFSNFSIPAHIRQKQVWLLKNLESPGFATNRWAEEINDFNGTITYAREPGAGRLYYPYGTATKKKTKKTSYDYAKNKTKSAYAFVSNCESVRYGRLDVMKRLGKYIDVDIFGKCTKRTQCPKGAAGDCEKNLASAYRFYLAFENSLCKDYITEKFWKILRGATHVIPVVLGGLSIDEYTAVGPPNSFIHVYNFSSIAQLGKYLQYLTSNNEAYNRYHEWRQTYTISMYSTSTFACDVCKIAHNPELLKSTLNTRFADDWNRVNNCRSFP